MAHMSMGTCSCPSIQDVVDAFVVAMATSVARSIVASIRTWVLFLLVCLRPLIPSERSVCLASVWSSGWSDSFVGLGIDVIGCPVEC